MNLKDKADIINTSYLDTKHASKKGKLASMQQVLRAYNFPCTPLDSRDMIDYLGDKI